MYGEFNPAEQLLVAVDSAGNHSFTFSEGISLIDAILPVHPAAPHGE